MAPVGSLNLHVYPSPITHESRISKEVRSIRALGIFDRIEVAGVGAPGLPAEQQWYDGVTIRRLSTESTSRGLGRKVEKAIGFGRALIRQYRREPLACINCHSVAALPACIALKRLTGARLVYDTHELETETQGLSVVRKALYKSIERVGIGQIDYAIFVTKSIEEWYRDTYGLDSCATLYNYPEPTDPLGLVGPKYFHERFQLDPDTKIFLYQGVMGEGRGIRELLGAFEKPVRTDVALVLLGFGSLADEVRHIAHSLNSVYFHEAVTPEELPDFTRAADFGTSLLGSAGNCLALSNQFAGPNKLFQCIQAEVPVLASPVKEQLRVLVDYPAGLLVKAVTPRDIADGVAMIANRGRQSFREAIVRGKRDLVWTRYDPLFKEIYIDTLRL